MGAQRIAAIDVGSNTVHLVVVEARNGEPLRESHREVLMPRIGAAVPATGRIGAAKIAEVAEGLRRLASIAKSHGASTLLLGATEAVRRAADQEEAVRGVSEAAGG